MDTSYFSKEALKAVFELPENLDELFKQAEKNNGKVKINLSNYDYIELDVIKKRLILKLSHYWDLNGIYIFNGFSVLVDISPDNNGEMTIYKEYRDVISKAKREEHESIFNGRISLGWENKVKFAYNSCFYPI